MGAVERALQADADWAEILQPTASIRGSVSGLAVELIEDHIRNHVVDPADQKLARQAEGARQLIDVVRTYLK
ncbi:metal-sensing transcriptional repressor [Aminobacter sp. P9b]